MMNIHPTISINSSRQVATVATVPDRMHEELEPPLNRVPTSSTNLEQAVAVSTNSTKTTPSMANFVISKKPLPINKIHQLDEQLVKMIAKGYHALRMVDEVEFRKFVEMLNPGYTLPTRKTLSETLLPKVYNKILETVKKEIAKASAICITTDAWTSIVNDGYIAVTGHFIDTEMHRLCTVMIGCIECDQRHTSANLKSFLEAKFLEWKIHQHVNVIVSDNASNILAAVRQGGWRSLSCYAHTINLVVQSSIAEISETVNRVKVIVEYFHRSNPAKRKLTEMEDQMNISQLKLKQDVPTRWNSTYDMLMRVVRVKEALIATLAIMRPDISLPQDDWLIIEKAVELLKIFYVITVEVSGENYVSASKYIVFCKIINWKLHRYSHGNIDKIQNLHNALRSQMLARFGEVEKNMLLCESTILDPRFKKSGFSDLRNFERAASAMKTKIGITSTPEPEVQQPPIPQQMPQPEEDFMWGDFDAEIAVLVPQNPTAAGIVEFDTYMEEPLLRRTDNPLLWWSERKSVYPRLYKYMLKRLNITATSVPCERVFSKAGLTLNERRTRLKTKKLSQLLFISCN